METLGNNLEKEKLTANQLAHKFERFIKGAIVHNIQNKLFEKLYLVDHPDWAYFDQYSSNVLCCLVTSQKGYLYLVTATVDDESENLSNFKVQTIS